MIRLYCLSTLTRSKPIALLLLLCLVPGCDSSEVEDTNGGETPPEVGLSEDASVCTGLSQPCDKVSANPAGTVVTCRLATTTCGVDLADVISQVQFDVTEETVMWIQAWGGTGGDSDDASCDGGAGGYAQTTTSVSDIRSMNSDSSAQMFYYLASSGENGKDQCGSAGGSATIVTLADLTIRRSQGPSLASPPTLLVAGGGGGSGSDNGDGLCISGCFSDAGYGGVAIARSGKNGSGSGSSPESTGGMGGGSGAGGVSACDTCALCNVCKSGNETSGEPLFGGRGGAGGSGPKCSGPEGPRWINTGSSPLDMISGAGGKGSSNTKACDAGGGGGGGGWGGGGGGGHGNDIGHAISGGGGGSFAISSTRTTSLAPTERKSNPCKSSRNGCVQLQFAP